VAKRQSVVGFYVLIRNRHFKGNWSWQTVMGRNRTFRSNFGWRAGNWREGIRLRDAMTVDYGYRGIGIAEQEDR
jgi:hypothetical protein